MSCSAMILGYSLNRANPWCETAAELRNDCIPLPDDVSTVNGTRALASRLQASEPSIDVLVDHESVTRGPEFEEFFEQDRDEVFDLDAKPPFFRLQALLETNASRETPAEVISIGSIDGMRISLQETHSYQISNAAIHQLPHRMAASPIPDGIVVGAIALDASRLQPNRAMRDKASGCVTSVPAGRVGRRKGIPAAPIHLASRAGDYVVGEVLSADGGAMSAVLPEMVDPRRYDPSRTEKSHRLRS